MIDQETIKQQYNNNLQVLITGEEV